jgi:hypothetical protein
MSKPYKEVCGNCYFGVPIPKCPMVECHRFPPSITGNKDPRILEEFPVFPVVNDREWCGEWSPIQEVKGVDWD